MQFKAHKLNHKVIPAGKSQTNGSSFRNSFWEQHKRSLFKYGQYYAMLFGLSVISYIPKPINTVSHKSLVIYSHLLSICLILVLPIYFAYNFHSLLQTKDGSSQVQVLVNVASTLLKWLTLIVTYLTNLIYYSEIRNITRIRQHLEDTFGLAWTTPRIKFERMLLFKFCLINATMIAYGWHISLALWSDGSVSRSGSGSGSGSGSRSWSWSGSGLWLGLESVQFHFELYRFVMWNYTENMMNYFLFINISAVKFYRQLNEEVFKVYKTVQDLQQHHNERERRRRGLFVEHCRELSERFNVIAERYSHIHALCTKSLHMQQFQILGFTLMTLISNLTNFFKLVNLVKQTDLDTPVLDASNDSMAAMPMHYNVNHKKNSDAFIQLIFSSLFAFLFYVDTYVIILINDQMQQELTQTRQCLRRFNEFFDLDARLEQAIEYVALQLRSCKVESRVCGLFAVNRRLAFLIAATGVSYFITLIQFDMQWRSSQ